MLKKAMIVIAVALILTVSAITVVAQSTGVPFAYWPALYDAMEHSAVKRGITTEGLPNGFMYFRIGWGECLVVGVEEWQDLIDATPTNRYMNLRNHAESRHGGEWTVEHRYNCPPPPLEVKPYWRGSRPVYHLQHDAVSGYWIRGDRSPYRVAAPSPAVSGCAQFGARKTSGEPTSYHQLLDAVEVTEGDAVHIVGDLRQATPGLTLAAVCREVEGDILDYRIQ